MRKEIILEKFSILNCIIDSVILEQYVDFCIVNDIGKKIKNRSASHHILPCAKTLPFTKYKCFNTFSWNKCELSYYNHYIAHYLLTKAVRHISIQHAFISMHNRDIKNERIRIDDLISENIYDAAYIVRNNMISEYRKEIITTEYGNISRAKYIYQINKNSFKSAHEKTSKRMKTDNIVNLPGILEKIRKTKSSTFIDGKNIDTVSAERSAETMKKEIIVNGNVTSIYKETGKKVSKRLNSEFIDIDGNTTTIAKQRAKKQRITIRAKSDFYFLKNVFDCSFCETLCAIDIRKINLGLEHCTKENYLGKTTFAYNYYTKNNKKHFIGLYVEKLEKEQHNHILHPN